MSSDHFFFLLLLYSRLFACLLPYFASRWSIIDPLLLRIASYGTVESVHYIQSNPSLQQSFSSAIGPLSLRLRQLYLSAFPLCFNYRTLSFHSLPRIGTRYLEVSYLPWYASIVLFLYPRMKII